ncbi:MAG TPA: hypothetical protein PLH68_04340, partial [Anaerolineaceae bacterium]|nr:hypothetical protein [Anaerolineaceae bacterium]
IVRSNDNVTGEGVPENIQCQLMNAEVLLISCRGALIQISGIKMWLLGQMKMLPGRQAKRNNQPGSNTAFWG